MNSMLTFKLHFESQLSTEVFEGMVILVQMGAKLICTIEFSHI
eukprot:UN03606